MNVAFITGWQRSWGLTTLTRQVAEYALELGHDIWIQDFSQCGFRYPEDPLDGYVTDDMPDEDIDVAVFFEFAGRPGARQLVQKYRLRGSHVVWVPMVEFVYKNPSVYQGIDQIVSLTPLTKETLAGVGLQSAFVPWSLNPQTYRDPKEKEHTRRPTFLHFARMAEVLKPLVACWAMAAEPCEITVKGKLGYAMDPEHQWWKNDPPPWMKMMTREELTGEELTKLYDAHDAVMMPTPREGLGLPALEGIARGLYPLYLDGTATQSLLQVIPLPQIPSNKVPRHLGEWLLDYLVEPEPASIAFFATMQERPASWTPALREAQAAMAEWWRHWVRAWAEILDGRAAPEFEA